MKGRGKVARQEEISPEGTCRAPARRQQSGWWSVKGMRVELVASDCERDDECLHFYLCEAGGDAVFAEQYANARIVNQVQANDVRGSRSPDVT